MSFQSFCVGVETLQPRVGGSIGDPARPKSRRTLSPFSLLVRSPLASPSPLSPTRTVIATLGPACRDVETLKAMLEAGMACARVDLTVSGKEGE